MKSSWTYFVFIAVGALLCFLIMKQCKKEPLGPSEIVDKHYVDSLVSIHRDSIVLPYRDSIRQKDKVIDSLRNIVNADKVIGNDKENALAKLLSEIQLLKNRKDTIKQVAACDSLWWAAADGLVLIKKITKDRDNLDSNYRAQLSLKDSATSRLSLMFRQSNNDLFQCGLKYDQLMQQYKKINKPIKHWSIGPGGGVTIINGKVQPVIEVSAHYKLFEF